MKNVILLFFLFTSYFALQAQVNSTGGRVYQIFQDKCVSCHNNASPEAGLDLEGEGGNVNQKAQDVFSNIFNVTPLNAAAAANGVKYIYPGRPDKSFIFKKINQGLEPTISLESGEEGPMPPSGNSQLSNEEKELIRQWILYGAPSSGEVIDEQLLVDYYNGAGEASFPDEPPAPPAAGEGFQIKMGPFFIEPGGEVEYFQKYELDLPEDVEVDRLEMIFSNYSHHFILYNFTGNGANAIPDGLRLNSNHSNINVLAVAQETFDLELPDKTAFFWEDDLVLDLNSHYINYNFSKVYQAEAYLNVYTQDVGVAVQQMEAALIANTSIYIPNNGNTITETQTVNNFGGELFVWGLMGHTHQWGTGYKVYDREDGGKGELVYDASCPGGIPGCVSPFFDYHHIPMRYFDAPFYNIKFGGPDGGFIHEATWENNGPNPVWFGPTSDDEMMVMIAMYLEDTTGLNIPSQQTTSLENISSITEKVDLFPNPMTHMSKLYVEEAVLPLRLHIYDVLGKPVKYIFEEQSEMIIIEKDGMSSGLYFYQLEDGIGRKSEGKLIIRD